MILNYLPLFLLAKARQQKNNLHNIYIYGFNKISEGFYTSNWR